MATEISDTNGEKEQKAGAQSCGDEQLWLSLVGFR